MNYDELEPIVRRLTRYAIADEGRNDPTFVKLCKQYIPDILSYGAQEKAPTHKQWEEHGKWINRITIDERQQIARDEAERTTYLADHRPIE